MEDSIGQGQGARTEGRSGDRDWWGIDWGGVSKGGVAIAGPNGVALADPGELAAQAIPKIDLTNVRKDPKVRSYINRLFRYNI